MSDATFEWNSVKEHSNIEKHGVSFSEAQYAFLDKNRIIAEDVTHSQSEKRYYCFGMVKDKVMTVRFTYRNQKIRIIGAGYWRQGKKTYEENQKK